MHFVSHPTRTFPTYYLEISLGLTAYSLFHPTNGMPVTSGTKEWMCIMFPGHSLFMIVR